MDREQMFEEKAMNKQNVHPAKDANEKRVYVGALIPLKHYNLLVEEAERANVSRSHVLRWALAERYDQQDTDSGHVTPCSREKE